MEGIRTIIAKVNLPAIANLGGCHGNENKQNSRKMDFGEKNLLIGPIIPIKLVCCVRKVCYDVSNEDIISVIANAIGQYYFDWGHFLFVCVCGGGGVT